MIKKIDHFVITTNCIKDCLNFYQQLGFESFNQTTYWILKAGDFKINVHLRNQELEPKAQTVQCGSADFCLEIDEQLGDVMKRLSETNLHIELGVVKRNGVRGIMDSVYLRDPDGNLVELCHYE